MAQKRCTNGHYYDESKHVSCPYCGIHASSSDKTQKIDSDVVENTSRIETQRITPPHASSDVTVRLTPAALGIDPVVGWLVCVDGPERGRDYRIRSERNFIGRSPKMNICIAADESISRDKHAIISYNPKSGSFTFMPGDGQGLIYHNGEEVVTPVRLAPYDLLELGKSGFLFIPFCSERFQWQSEEA
jgi:hypothetical protein